MNEKQKEWRYDFGKLPKFEANNMWRCDILTGELTKAKLEKEHRWEMLPNGAKTARAVPQKQLVNFYWIMTKSNYFFLPAKTREEAKEKFEEQFLKAEEHIKKQEENKSKECLKKV